MPFPPFNAMYLESHDFAICRLVHLLCGVLLKFLLDEPQQMFLVEAGRTVYVRIHLNSWCK